MVKIGKLFLTLLMVVAAIVFAIPAFASTSDGTIDSTAKWVWSEKIGWINFGVTSGNVHVTDSGLTGYAWNDLYGWIKLNPSTSGVANNNEGTLSGSAWGENIGWIDFTGVVINASGVFTGTASGTNTGIINFDCTNCSVKTDWRPASARVSAPAGGVAFPVNIFGAPAGGAVTEEVTTTAPPLPPIVTTTTLPPAEVSVPPVKISPIASIAEKLKGIVGGLVAQISKIPRFKLPVIPIAKLYDQIKLWTPYFFKLPPKAKIPIEQFVSKKTPLALKGQWEHLDPKSTQRFVFAPLPKDFLALEKKFPEVRNTFKRVGINRLGDIEKMKSVQMYLPGLTRSTGLTPPQIGAAKYEAPKSIPLDEMPDSLKAKIPSEVIFVRAGGQMVDFKIALSLTAKGRAEQKINTISGKTLQLTVRPEKPVKRIRGFVVFRSKKPQIRAEIQLKNLVSSLVFAEPALAFEQKTEVEMEEKLVLLEFEYTDPDGDGIYTADIESPIPAGEYEIITVMDYEDPDLGSKQIRLITVVDPEGYVYEKISNKELRIPGAIVTLYYFNPETKQYEEWPAKDFQQENPQITDIRGTYSFLVPGGAYYTKVEAPGYISYESKPYQVEEGGGVHMNVELKTRYWWLKIFDWKTVLLILVSVFLAVNFYKDKQNKNKRNNLIN